MDLLHLLSSFLVQVCQFVIDNLSDQDEERKRKDEWDGTGPSSKRARTSCSGTSTDALISTAPEIGCIDLHAVSDRAQEPVDSFLFSPIDTLDSNERELSLFEDINIATDNPAPAVSHNSIPKRTMSNDPVWSSTSVPDVFCLVVDNTDEDVYFLVPRSKHDIQVYTACHLMHRHAVVHLFAFVLDFQSTN